VTIIDEVKFAWALEQIAQNRAPASAASIAEWALGRKLHPGLEERYRRAMKGQSVAAATMEGGN
jgi:hypothetical protein